MLSLRTWSRSAFVASAGLIAVCGILVIDDELHARQTRAELRDFWLPARTMNRELLEAEKMLESSMAALIAAPDKSNQVSAELAVDHLHDTLASAVLPQGGSQLRELALASSNQAQAWLAARASAIAAPNAGDDQRQGWRSEQSLTRTTRAHLTALNSGAVQARQSLSRTNTVLRITAVIETALLLSLLALLLFGLRYRVLAPLVRLRADLDRSTRHIAHAITPTGPREISAVAHDAESLRRSLVHEQDISEHATQALTQLSPLTVAFRNELDRHDSDVSGVVGFHRPAEGVIAGDWWWAGQSARGARMFAVADVSGHGVPAGILALESRTLVTAALTRGERPDAVCRQLADQDFRPGMFLTLFIGLMHDNTLEYCSAGHQDAAAVGRHTSSPLPTTGPIISALGGNWRLGRVQLSPSSVVVVATDGLLDQVPNGSFTSLAQSAWHRSKRRPRELLELLLADARELSTNWKDDVTVVIATADPPID